MKKVCIIVICKLIKVLQNQNFLLTYLSYFNSRLFLELSLFQFSKIGILPVIGFLRLFYTAYFKYIYFFSSRKIIMNWPTSFGFDDLCEPTGKRVEPQKPKKAKVDSEDFISLDPSFSFKVPRSVKKESQVSWVDTYEPKSFSELVVHHKKLEEVEMALRNPQEKILLLTGPSGSGKTTSLKCICKKLGIGKLKLLVFSYLWFFFQVFILTMNFFRQL